MAGEKDRDPGASATAGRASDRGRTRHGEADANRVPMARADTTTWGGGVAPPGIQRIPAAMAKMPVSATEPGPSPMRLERLEPSWVRGERIELDPRDPMLRVGRAEFNDIRLYTASSSREHATIRCDGVGRWWVIPADGTSIEIDGYPLMESTALEADMNIVLGEDHLRCVSTESEFADSRRRDAGSEILGPKRSWTTRWGLGVAFLLGIIGTGFGLLSWFGG